MPEAEQVPHPVQFRQSPMVNIDDVLLGLQDGFRGPDRRYVIISHLHFCQYSNVGTTYTKPAAFTPTA
ncbi:MAG: hypothetical protein ABIX37_12090 [Gammaproteobacteria bacterium]